MYVYDDKYSLFKTKWHLHNIYVWMRVNINRNCECERRTWNATHKHFRCVVCCDRWPNGSYEHFISHAFSFNQIPTRIAAPLNSIFFSLFERILASVDWLSPCEAVWILLISYASLVINQPNGLPSNDSNNLFYFFLLCARKENKKSNLPPPLGNHQPSFATMKSFILKCGSFRTVSSDTNHENGTARFAKVIAFTETHKKYIWVEGDRLGAFAKSMLPVEFFRLARHVSRSQQSGV